MHALIPLALQLCGGGFVLLVLAQHIANLRRWSYHPSDTLTAWAEWAMRTARRLGTWLARVSYALIRMCRLGDLALAAWQVAEPMACIALSWLLVPMGYFAFAFTLGRRAMVLWGTVVLSALASLAYNYLMVYRPGVASGAIALAYRAYLCTRAGWHVSAPVLWTGIACLVGDFLFMVFYGDDLAREVGELRAAEAAGAAAADGDARPRSPGDEHIAPPGAADSVHTAADVSGKRPGRRLPRSGLANEIK